MEKKDTNIEADCGVISGVVTEDPSIISYLGIPYAAPPVGNLRWKPPHPVFPWEGVRKAETFGNSAMQPPQEPFMVWTEEFIIRNKVYSEDSLTLNIWTELDSDALKPVIFFIHGGGLISGGSSCEVYTGTEIAGKGAVFVSINYRLGIFGFFAHPDLTAESPENASGNYGLLDIIAGLKWVKRNISSFGGDPDNITIMGQSAGSRIVNALLISPLAKGLFHRALAQSANPFQKIMSIKVLSGQEKLGSDFMSYAGIDTIDELRAIPAEELLQKAGGFKGDGLLPGYEPAITNEGFSIISSDLDAHRNSRINDVPYMTGMVSGDIMFFGPRSAVTLQQYRDEAEKKFGQSSKTFLKLYPASNDEEAEKMLKTIAAADEMNMMSYMIARAKAEAGRCDSYLYFFTKAMPTGEDVENRGAFHTADVPYFLNHFYRAPSRPWDDSDFKLGEQLSGYLVNFAETGNPNGNSLPHWPSSRESETNIMELGEQIRMYGGISEERFLFWKSFFENQYYL